MNSKILIVVCMLLSIGIYAEEKYKKSVDFIAKSLRSIDEANKLFFDNNKTTIDIKEKKEVLIRKIVSQRIEKITEKAAFSFGSLLGDKTTTVKAEKNKLHEALMNNDMKKLNEYSISITEENIKEILDDGKKILIKIAKNDASKYDKSNLADFVKKYSEYKAQLKMIKG